MTEEVKLLKEMSRKLSQLIVLTKLSNSKVIEDTKKEIRKDKASRTVLDLADGSLSSSQLKEKVMAQTKVSEPTVKRRIAGLVEKGALTFVRKGKEIYYENSGLYD
jgi:Fic family protein